MYASRIDLPDHVRKAATRLLQARLSEALDLDAQLKQAHWNVRGMGFFGLHQLFDQLHGEVEGFADTLAERIATLGEVADGRVQTTAASSQLYLYALETVAGVDHLRAIAAAMAQFGRGLRVAIDDASALPDADTADVLTEVSRAIDKQLWLVEAHLAGT